MGEFFELAFFSPKDSFLDNASNAIQTALSLHIGHNTAITNSFALFEGKNIWFDVIEGEAFVEYLVAVENLVMVHSNLNEVLNQICEVVDQCFSVAPEIPFATGIYELTGYYLQDASTFDDIKESVFPKAPLLFFREKPDCVSPVVKYSNELYYTLQQNENVQCIIS